MLVALCSLPLLAQGPFAAPLQSVETLALLFARVMSVVAIIVGCGMMAFGDGHRASGFMAMLLGVGGMAMAQQLVAWLFNA